jgi:hypothetical protein
MSGLDHRASMKPNCRQAAGLWSKGDLRLIQDYMEHQCL